LTFGDWDRYIHRVHDPLIDQYPQVDKLGMVGVNGNKFTAIRAHLEKNIAQVYKDLDVSFDSFPGDNETNPDAYKVAIDKFKPGDAVVIFTPDNTHYAIARYAIERGLHVLVTKPATQLLSHHLELIDLSRKHNVVCFVEHHKRFAPLSLYHEVLSYAYGRLDTTQSTAMHEPVRGHLASSISSTPG